VSQVKHHFRDLVSFRRAIGALNEARQVLVEIVIWNPAYSIANLIEVMKLLVSRIARTNVEGNIRQACILLSLTLACTKGSLRALLALQPRVTNA
jgi:hypothetical protein